eukprot:COSAG01_NODE_37737_length_499_cov_1.445000_1_plen_65_part_00
MAIAFAAVSERIHLECCQHQQAWFPDCITLLVSFLLLLLLLLSGSGAIVSFWHCITWWRRHRAA